MVYQSTPMRSTLPVLAFLTISSLYGYEEAYSQPIPGTGFTIDMVLIPGGTFVMGHPNEAQTGLLNMPSFYMSVHEITYDQYLPHHEIQR